VTPANRASPTLCELQLLVHATGRHGSFSAEWIANESSEIGQPERVVSFVHSGRWITSCLLRVWLQEQPDRSSNGNDLGHDF